MKLVTIKEVKNGLTVNGHFKKYNRDLGALMGVKRLYEYGSHNIISLYGENNNTGSILNIQPYPPREAQSLKDKFIAYRPVMLSINYDINRDFRLRDD